MTHSPKQQSPKMMGMQNFADPAFLTKEQREALRAYVTADDSGFQNQVFR